MVTYQKKQANLQSYRTTDVSTAGRLKLLVMLYEGAIRFGHQAEQAIVKGDPATKGTMIGKVMAIVDELTSTLDHSKAPEIAANLERLYDFIRDRLIKANVKNDVQPLQEAIAILNTLHSAWLEVSRKPAAELATEKTDQAPAGKPTQAQAVNANNYVRLSV